DDIILVLEGNGAELEARARRNQPSGSNVDWLVVIFIALWATLLVGSIGFSLLAPIYGRKIGPGRYEWLGVEVSYGGSGGGSSGGGSSGWSSGSRSSGWSSGGGGFSGGGGSSGGGGASGSW